MLTPKGGREFWGIGIIEVLWKTVILNRRLRSAITLHNMIHGFPAGRWAGKISLKVKLLQQLTANREEVLYVIFLDLHKAYTALDMGRWLVILEGYRVGPWDRRILHTYLYRLTMVTCAGCNTHKSSQWI